MNLFITGASGFIGKQVLSQLAPKCNKIFLLSRTKSLLKTKEFFKEFDNITFIEGDITQDEVVKNIEDLKLLQNNVNTVLNIAGHYDIEVSELDSYKTNIIGLQNIINLSLQFSKLTIFHHISSYVAAGSEEKILKETTLGNAKKFGDYYSRSKMQGEVILKKSALSKIKIRIYRPGIVIGSSESGNIEKTDGPYYFMKFINKYQEILKHLNQLKVFPLPFNQTAILPLIPVDILSNWLCEAVVNPTKHKIRTYHLVSKEQIKLKDFVEWLFKEYSIDLKLTQLPESDIYKHLLPTLGMPKELLQYMYYDSKLDISNKEEDYPHHQSYALEDITSNLIKGSKRFFKES